MSKILIIIAQINTDMKKKEALTSVAIMIASLLVFFICLVGVIKDMNPFLLVGISVAVVLLWIIPSLAVINRILFANDIGLSLLLYKAAKLKTHQGDTTDIENAIVRKCQGHREAWLGYRMLGELFTVRENSAKAWDYFKRCEEVFPADAKDADKAQLWNDIGGSALALKKHDQAKEYFLKASEVDPGYLRGCGLMYAFGWGVEMDTKKGYEYLKTATEKGCDFAISNLYELMWRESNDVSSLAIKGYLEYMNCCQRGKGLTAGLPSLKDSADQGYAPAQFELGGLYQSGSMKVDARTLKKEAYHWYHAAAAQGYLPALHNLGILAQQSIVSPLTGTVYEPKMKGTALYDIDAIKHCSLEGHNLLLRAAEAGYAPSQHSVGVRYIVGGETVSEGVRYTFFKVDRAEAWHWLTESARQGFSQAKADLKRYFGEET